MIGYSIVNSKGQITIPADIRRKLNINPGSSMAITENKNSLSVKRSEGYTALQGIVKTNIKMDQKKMRQDFINYLGTRKQLTK